MRGMIVAAALTLGTGACDMSWFDVPDDDWDEASWTGDAWWDDAEEIDVSAPALSGKFGGHVVRGSAPLTGRGSWDGFSDRVEVVATSPGGAVMAVVDVWDGLARLPVGRTLPVAPSAGIEVIGCSGPTVGDWTEDEGAVAGTITVTEGDDLAGPGGRTVTFQGRFADGTTLSGSFVAEAVPRTSYSSW